MIPVSVIGERKTVEELQVKALIKQIPLQKHIRVFNVDGTKNKVGKITHYAWVKIRIGLRQMDTRMLITGLGKDNLIFGLPWLKRHNPKINWTKGQMDLEQFGKTRRFSEILRKTIELSRAQTQVENTLTSDKQSLAPQIKEIFEDYPEERPRNLPLNNWQPILELADEPDEDNLDLLRTYIEGDDEPDDLDLLRSYLEEEEEVWIQTKKSISQELAQQAKEKESKPKATLPEFYQEYASVFDKNTSERMPSRRPWDHAIDLKEDFIPKDSKIYPMSPTEQEKLDEFIDKNLRKGYIRPSKSPMASPFFFVSKKDSAKLRPTQDYRRLNDGTIKNAYLLPLVGDLLDKLKGAKYFTKLDLRWGYNNVRIKEGDEWKAAFKTNRGLFEPLVMFFGLCNSPSTFQNMMNDIFAIELQEGWILIYIKAQHECTRG